MYFYHIKCLVIPGHASFIERRVGSGSFVSERVKLLSGANSRRHTETHSKKPHLSQRGNTIFQSGGLRDFLAPRPFAPGVSVPLDTNGKLVEHLHQASKALPIPSQVSSEHFPLV